MMKIALIQTELAWENLVENLVLLQQKIQSIKGPIDLIILPEMFSSGFTMHPTKAAQTMDGESISWLKETAKRKNCAITGSLVIEENGNYYNRLVFVFPSGEIQHYDKRHLFSLAGEDKIYTKGKNKLIIEYKGFKICPFICYDLRFPVFSRNVEDYDVLIFVANWPKTRINAWDTLLKARAIENMSYAIGVNRIGEDNNGYVYNGHSQAIDFLGNYVVAPNETAGVYFATLDKNNMLETRKNLGFLNDKDNFTVID